MASSTVFLLSNTSWYLYNFRRGTILALIEQGYRVVCFCPSDEVSVLLTSELGAEHVGVEMDGKSTGAVREARTLLAIGRMLRRERPAFVFNFTIKMNIYGGLVCQVLRIPYANNVSGLGTAFLHDSWLLRRVRGLYGFVNRAARTVFFQNEDDLAAFRSAGLLEGARVELLPGSGVDLDRFTYAPLPESEPRCFVMVARLLGDKGVREYVEAARWLKSKGVKARFLLVGPAGVSNVSAISAEEASGWHQEGVIEYLGHQQDVRPWLLQAHVLVLPSYREGMPRTVLEAAAMGRPAIVTDVPGCRQAVEADLTGWLCKARDASSLAECMLRAAEAPTGVLQEAGRRARARMELQFSEKHVVQAYLSCL